MFKSFTLKLLAISFLLMGGWACKSSDSVQKSAAQDNASSADRSSQAQDNSASEKEELYWARIDSAKMEFTEADAKFMTMMIGHHAQALVMSRLAPENGAGPQVQTLASRIINSQKDEIQSMQKWLRERNQPTVDLKIDGLDLMIDGHPSGHMDMVGMLSRKQLEELKQARDKEFDRLFLKYMIGHHKGAVVMVDNLLKVDGAAQEETAFKLASEINVDQQTEIDRMQRMLNRLSTSSQ
jgi:uncharacterized protein (DUF305 family)